MSKAFRLGLFIVATLLIFSAGVFWIGRKQFLFSSTYHLTAEFQNVSGLSEGAPVRVGGVPEGTIKRIDLPRRPAENVRVLMNLKRASREVIKKDSVASIKTEGLIGDKYLEISFGSEEAEKVKDGDTLASETPIEIADLIKKTNVLLDSARGAMDNLGDTTANMKSISGKINQGSGTIGALVNDTKLYQQANAGMSAFQENMQALKHNFFLRGFFKKRGYEDSTELTKHEIPQVPARQYSRKFVYDAAKLFDKPDSAKLEKEKPLREAGTFMEQNPFGLAVVAASTDMKGDAEKDRVLTEARAVVVRDYLVKNFKLDDTRVKTIGLGKSAGVDEGSSVEILIYPVGTPRAKAQPRAREERVARSSQTSGR